jgi:hypothetical protein
VLDVATLRPVRSFSIRKGSHEPMELNFIEGCAGPKCWHGVTVDEVAADIALAEGNSNGK